MDEALGGQIVQIVAAGTGQRLDQYVTAALSQLSRTEVQRLIKAGFVLVNGKPGKPSFRLVEGDIVTATLPVPETRAIVPETVPLDILYEDDDLVAINKPAGMVVHPSVGNWSGTLVNAALARWPEMRRVTGEERAGVVHRLDKDTSGVLVLAKTSTALRSLQAQFQARTVYKRYIALVEGVPDSRSGIIDAPIGRDPRQRKQMAVVRSGREAVTRYDVVEDFGSYALLSIEPMTGRTHQIRVHLAWLGHPVVGDRVYGTRRQRTRLKRLLLHATELHVDSPSAGMRLRFEAPMPDSLQDILTKLRRNPGGWG